MALVAARLDGWQVTQNVRAHMYMIQDDAHIALIYQEPIITSEVISGFADDIETPNLNVQVEPIPMMGARAGVEWFLPTAIVAYIAKPYFESFLSEMGKDHYAIAKKAFANLQARVMANFRDRLRTYATNGKLHPDSATYSPVFSIVAQVATGLRIKLLIQTEIKPDHFNKAVEAFIPFAAGNERFDEIIAQVNQIPCYSKSTTILVCYSEESKQLELVNPFPEQRKP